MNNEEAILKKLDFIEKETRRVRNLFGTSIVLLALILMVLAPEVIRSYVLNPQSNSLNNAADQLIDNAIPTDSSLTTEPGT